VSESVGKISLDLEVKSDLGGQLNDISSSISQSLRNSLKNSTSKAFDEMRKNSQSSVKGIANSMQATFDKMSKNIKSSLSKALDARRSMKAPQHFSNNAVNAETSTQKASTNKTTRGSPASINTETIQSQMENVEKAMDNVEAKISAHKQKLNSLKETYASTFNVNTKSTLEDKMATEEGAIIRLQGQMDTLGQKYTVYEGKLQSAAAAMQSESTAAENVVSSFNAIGSAAQRQTTNLSQMAKAGFGKIGSAASGITGKISNLAKKLPSLSSGLSSSGRAAKNAASGMHGFGNSISKASNRIIKFMIVMPLIRKGIMAMGNYMMSALKTNDQFSNSLAQIKTNLATAFMPIYQAILPAINALMSAVAQITAYLASFLSLLFGKTFDSSYQAAQGLNAAKDAMDEYGSSASSAAEAAKEAQRELMGFDQVNKLSDNSDSDSGGSGGAGLATPTVDTSAIDSQMSGLAEKVKNIFSQIFKPFQESWALEGANTIANVKYALGSVWELVKSIGGSFLDIWTNGTGTKMLSTILQIVQDIFMFVGNLATGFKNAWEENNVGTRIVQTLFDLLQIVLDTIKKITGATAEWGKNLNFSPLLESVGELLEKFKPVLQTIGDTLSWIWTDIVLPLLKALIESFLPKVLDLLSGLFNFLENNKGIVEAITVAVVAFFVSFKTVSIASSAIKVLSGALTFITSPIGMVTLAIGALIAIGVLLYKNWDEVCVWAKTTWGKIKEIFASFGNWIKSVFETDWTKSFGVIGDVLNAFFKNAEDIFKSVKQIFTGVIDFITGIFTGNWSKAWDGLVTIVKGIFNGIVAVVKAPINSVIGILNGFIGGINKIKIPSWVPAIGGKGINIPKIPLLARGGIIDSPTLAMVGEAGKEAVMPLENNTGWMQEFANKLAPMLNTGGSPLSAEVISLLKEILTVLKNLDFDFIMDGDSVKNKIVKRINQNTSATGVCEIKF